MLAIAEHLKKALSANDAAAFSCRRRCRPRRRGGEGEEEEEETVTVRVTRREFEEKACKGVFARALAPVDRVLESNGMSHAEIDEVVMVGGEWIWGGRAGMML